MQMRTVKLSQIGFGYFSYNPKNDRKENYLLVTKNTSNGRPVVLRAREQVRACVKWDLVDCYIFIFSNFERQYFRFRSVNFFQIFGDN